MMTGMWRRSDTYNMHHTHSSFVHTTDMDDGQATRLLLQDHSLTRLLMLPPTTVSFLSQRVAGVAVGWNRINDSRVAT